MLCNNAAPKLQMSSKCIEIKNVTHYATMVSLLYLFIIAHVALHDPLILLFMWWQQLRG